MKKISRKNTNAINKEAKDLELIQLKKPSV